MIRGRKLDPSTHDLAIEGGAFVFVDGIEATAQEIKTRLLFFRGEWFLDVREGVPYYQEILRKGVDVRRVREIIRAAIRSVPTIVDVPLVTVDVDRATRTAAIGWSARTITGQLVRSEDYGPLILDL